MINQATSHRPSLDHHHHLHHKTAIQELWVSMLKRVYSGGGHQVLGSSPSEKDIAAMSVALDARMLPQKQLKDG